ncbi:OLC1v1036725C1 [Oldenlandia corymbosa var. corymbosa]|uniref:OLC1v1036725C1 n=1 Tax=Oldenlandia corymbosa var. corymbosa TaxID=529605 RepID=A0AAV1CXH7_OLDCO|nr:OLC1v1036725C1 [Oldenlandia corymbosa var. corymbosa]
MANDNFDDQHNDVVAAVMVPLPAQGHLNQLLHLSHILSSHGLSVHFVGTPSHNRQAQVRLHGWDPEATSKIHFHNFPIPAFPIPPPNPNATNKLPVHLFPAFTATVHLRQPISELVKNLSITSRRVIVIHDSLMFYVIQDAASVPNAESYCFHSLSAFAMYVNSSERTEKLPAVLPDGVPVKDLLINGGSSSGILFPAELMEFFKLQRESRKRNWGNLFNTSRLIESEYLDSLAEEKLCGSEKNWAIGPFNPVLMKNLEKRSSEKQDKCLDWLDKQLSKSVIFVSFGSNTSLSDEQNEEIANGLKNSGQKFIWVIREGDRGDVFAAAKENQRARLPDGYEEEIENRGMGMIVRDWAPQLDILRHPSTGGFMSHCGWNSCIESISLGVAMAAWPMHSDQPINAILVTRILKVGLMVGEFGHEGELVKADVIENAVKKLMDSAEGDEIKKKAAELSDAIKKSVTKGDGEIVNKSRTEMDTFIAHITR